MRPFLPTGNDKRRNLLDWADRLVRHCNDPKSRDWPRTPLPRERVAQLAADSGRAMAYLFNLNDPEWELEETTFFQKLRKGELPGLKPIEEKDVQMGDLLVYFDPVSKLMHAVVVVDSADQIAVGAFPWSEKPRFGFQKILSKRDWGLLGFPKAGLLRCYRLAEHPNRAPNHRGVTALKTLSGICNPGRFCQ